MRRCSMVLLDILRRLGELVANWEVLRVVLDALTAFLRGETVPVVITWQRHRVVITVQLQETPAEETAAVTASAAARPRRITV